MGAKRTTCTTCTDFSENPSPESATGVDIAKKILGGKYQDVHEYYRQKFRGSMQLRGSTKQNKILDNSEKILQYAYEYGFVPTDGYANAGAERILAKEQFDGSYKLYYSPDHYGTFYKLRLEGTKIEVGGEMTQPDGDSKP